MVNDFLAAHTPGTDSWAGHSVTWTDPVLRQAVDHLTRKATVLRHHGSDMLPERCLDGMPMALVSRSLQTVETSPAICSTTSESGQTPVLQEVSSSPVGQ